MGDRNGFKTFIGSYNYQGSKWGFEILAANQEDAEARFAMHWGQRHLASRSRSPACQERTCLHGNRLMATSSPFSMVCRERGFAKAPCCFRISRRCRDFNLFGSVDGDLKGRDFGGWPRF